MIYTVRTQRMHFDRAWARKELRILNSRNCVEISILTVSFFYFWFVLFFGSGSVRCNAMSSFIMGYPHHTQSPMGGSSIDPKFPPSTDDLSFHHHHHHHHNGYMHNGGGMTAAMPPVNNDYINSMHHQSNGSIHPTSNNNYNYSHGISGHFYQHNGAGGGGAIPYNTQMHTSPGNGYTPNNNGYYGGYYGTNNGHQMMDLPIPCPTSAEEPTNTALGLQELGMWRCRQNVAALNSEFASWINKNKFHLKRLGLRLERRIEEAVPAGQQLQELGMRLRCDDSGSEHVSKKQILSPRWIWFNQGLNL